MTSSLPFRDAAALLALPKDARLPPADVVACGARADVPLCPDCVDAYRNGIEPDGTACDERGRA